MGPEFAKPSHAVLSILAVVHFLSLPHLTVSMILYGKSRHKILAIVKGIEALINIVLSLILVKPFGIVGVALGTAIPHIIAVTLVYPKIISRIVGIDLFEYYYRAYMGPIVSGLPFIAMCYYMRSQYVANNLFVFFSEILLILPLYILPAWIISFNKEERQWHLSYIKNWIRKWQRRKQE
jgi:O-antigen/teichoic acid export membrane protein